MLPRALLLGALSAAVVGVLACDSGASATTQPSGGSGGSGGGSGGSGAGAAGGSGGSGGSVGRSCKRGIAANVAPGPAFSGSVGWWYNWALDGNGAGAGIEHVPMVWGTMTLGDAIPAGSEYLLGFNEPNFHAQADMTAEEAATAWPTVEAQAAATGAAIVSPAMNFCGPADQCNGTSPYQYLKDFFAACVGCKVDYVAVHWYNCDLPSLQDYLEPGGNLEGFEQFGKPIWLTEFSCNPSASAAEQQAYMEAAIPYLEAKPEVYRYSWFSAGPIPNAKLVADDGSPTALGQVYVNLPGDCQ